MKSIFNVFFCALPHVHRIKRLPPVLPPICFLSCDHRLFPLRPAKYLLLLKKAPKRERKQNGVSVVVPERVLPERHSSNSSISAFLFCLAFRLLTLFFFLLLFFLITQMIFCFLISCYSPIKIERLRNGTKSNWSFRSGKAAGPLQMHFVFKKQKNRTRGREDESWEKMRGGPTTIRHNWRLICHFHLTTARSGWTSFTKLFFYFFFPAHPFIFLISIVYFFEPW